MTAAVTLQSIAVATADHLSAAVEGDTIILHSGTRTYYSLNPIAGRIWELLQEPRSIEAIRDSLLQEYDVDPDRCEAELMQFLEALADEDLVELRSP